MDQSPQISIATFFDYGIPIKEQLELISQAGFTHVSLSVRPEHSRYLEPHGRKLLKDQLNEYGLSIDTIHGQTFKDDSSTDEAISTIRAAADLEIRRVVFHPGAFHFPSKQLSERFQLSLRISNEIEPILRDYGIQVAYENVMPGPATELTCLLLAELDPAVFGFCYDSSHDQLGGPRPFQLLEDLQDHLIAVHLSDRSKEFVDHQIPGEGFIDFETIIHILRTVRFPHPILMEVMIRHSKFKDPQEFLNNASKAALEIWSATHYSA